jgi:hypothetical protein
VNGKEYAAGLYPCKVVAIVPFQVNDFLEETELVVQCALDRAPEKDSVLFKEWTLSDSYECVPTSSVDSLAFVLNIGNNKISVAIPYSEWPQEFTDTSY